MLSSQLSVYNSNIHGVSKALLLVCLCMMMRMPCAADDVPQRPASGGVGFNGFVNWDFHHRLKLGSWKTTAIVIQKTLAIWYPQHVRFSLLENGSPEEFEGFLHALPDGNDCDISVVYLASHQSPVAEWDFTQRRYLTLNQALKDTTVPPHPGRIVILDACYAAAALKRPLWQKNLAPISLFASSDSEETPDVNFHSARLVDFAHRYPEAYAWLKKNLGWSWNGKISFLGFVWVQTFITSKSAPASMNEWIDFLQRCQATASDYRNNVSRIPSSAVTAAIDDRQAREHGKPRHGIRPSQQQTP